MALNFERLMRAFFGLGNNVGFHCTDCRLVSGSYVNTQVLLQLSNSTNLVHSQCVAKGPNTIPCDVLFIHLAALLEPFLHKPFSCSIIPLELVEYFPCPN